MSSEKSKGNTVKLKTFNTWPKTNLIGYKTIEKEGVTYVNFVWCKVCARNEAVIRADKSCRGEAAEAMLKYVKGTNYVTKHTVMRHFDGKAHKIAVDHENTKDKSDAIPITP